MALLATLCMPAGSALARSAPPPYQAIGPVVITAQVAGDGSLSVSEDRTLRPTGTYRYVRWDLPEAPGVEITVRGVAQVDGGAVTPFAQTGAMVGSPGTYVVEDTGDGQRIHAYLLDRRAAKVTVRLTYTVNGTVKRWADVGDLSWQFVSPQWIPTSSAGALPPTTGITITIAPPVRLSQRDVLAWVHGPLDGAVSVDDAGSVEVTVSRLSRSDAVEVRILYPEKALAAVAMDPRPQRQAILDEEARIAAQVDVMRERAGKTARLDVIASLVLSALGLAASAWAFLRYGRRYVPQFNEEYLSEDPAPDLPPAVVGLLAGGDGAGSAELAATVMDMGVRGRTRLTPETGAPYGIGTGYRGRGYGLAHGETGHDGQAVLDSALAGYLIDTIGDGDKVDLRALEPYTRRHARRFAAWMMGWKAAVLARARSVGLIETNGEAWRPWLLGGAVVVVTTGVWASASTADPLPRLVALPAAIVMAILAARLRRHSPEGVELQARYAALRRYLEDIPELDASPTSVKQWSRLVILAVLFGVADQVLARVRTVAPGVMDDPGFQEVRRWVERDESGRSPVAAVQEHLAAASRTALRLKSWETLGGAD